MTLETHPISSKCCMNTHKTHSVHFFISKKYCNADNDYKWWMSLQFKKESVSLRTKIVQFNDDYGFVPTHDIHKVILLQSSKAYELTSCIHSNNMSIFLDEWFYYRNDLFITALLWMVLWQIKLQTRFSLKLLKVCKLLFLKGNRKMRNVNYYYKVFLYISLFYLLERR